MNEVAAFFKDSFHVYCDNVKDMKRSLRGAMKKASESERVDKRVFTNHFIVWMME